ncbi:MAG: AsmA family protein [Hyphomicrobiaceae bacterium]
MLRHRKVSSSSLNTSLWVTRIGIRPSAPGVQVWSRVMNTVLLTLGTIAVAILVALFAIPPLIDWNEYRGVFEAEASRVLGRDVRVTGDVSLTLLPQPYVRFEHVVVAAAPGVIGEPFLRADRFTMLLSTPPLLRGNVEAREVELDGARVRLRVDERGAGSWQDLSLSASAFGFGAADVSLRNVVLRNAEVVIERLSDGSVIGRLGDIDGVLSAETLAGPFRFSGSVKAAGATRTIRLTTGLIAEGRDLPLKLDVRDAADAARVAFDGAFLRAGDGSPRLAGQVTARLADLGFLRAQAPAAPGQFETGTPSQVQPAQNPSAQSMTQSSGAPLEIQAALSADLREARLEAIQIDFDRPGRPQSMTGRAQIDIGPPSRLDLELAAPWLETDTPPNDQSDLTTRGPFGMIDDVLETVRGLKGIGFDRSDVRLAVAQFSHNGTTLSDVSFEARATAGGVTLSHLGGAGPGGTVVAIDGNRHAGGQTFSGHVRAFGRNAAQFVDWLAPGATLPGLDAASFDIDGSLSIARGRVAVDAARIEIDRLAFDGGFSFEDPSSGRPARVSLKLSGRDVNVERFGADLIEPETLSRLSGLDQLWSPGDPRAMPASLGNPRDNVFNVLFSGRDYELDVDLDGVRSGATRLAALKLAVTRSGSDLAIRSGEVLFEGGGRVSLQGRVGSGASSMAISARVSAADSRSGTRVADWISRATGLRNRAFTAHDVPGFDVAVGLSQQRSGAGVESRMTVAGLIDGDRVDVDWRIAGGLDRIGVARGTLRASAERIAGVPAAWLMRRLVLGTRAGALDGPQRRQSEVAGVTMGDGAADTRPDIGPDASGPGRLMFVAEGAPETGLEFSAELQSSALEASLTGRLTLPAGDAARLAASLELTAPDALQLARALGADLNSLVGAHPLRLAGAVKALGPALEIDIVDAMIDRSLVSGRLALTPPQTSEAPFEIGGALSVSDLTYQRMLDAVLAPRKEGTASTAAGPETEIWPDRALVLSGFGGLVVDLTVAAERFWLTDAIAFADTRARVRASRGAVAVEDITGRSPDGGTFASRFTIAAEQGTFRLAGQLNARGVDLSRLMAKEEAEARATDEHTSPIAGRGEITLEVAASGLSPRAWASFMRGGGEIHHSGLVYRGADPAAVEQVAARFFSSQEPDVSALDRDLAAALAAFETRRPDGKLGLTITDGVALIDRIEASAPTGSPSASGLITVRIADLAFDSNWRLQPGSPAGTGSLPAVVVGYRGTLLDPGRMLTYLDAGQFGREVIVRQIERSVSSLEALRREDEARARAAEEALRQRERRQLEELERIRREQRRPPNEMPGGDPANGLNPSFEAAPVIIAPFPLPAPPRAVPGERQGLAPAAPSQVVARTVVATTKFSPEPQGLIPHGPMSGHAGGPSVAGPWAGSARQPNTAGANVSPYAPTGGLVGREHPLPTPFEHHPNRHGFFGQAKPMALGTRPTDDGLGPSRLGSPANDNNTAARSTSSAMPAETSAARDDSKRPNRTQARGVSEKRAAKTHRKRDRSWQVEALFGSR